MNTDRNEFENLLKLKQVSAYRVCQDLSIPQSTVSDWRNGKTKQIGNETLKQMINYLKNL